MNYLTLRYIYVGVVVVARLGSLCVSLQCMQQGVVIHPPSVNWMVIWHGTISLGVTVVQKLEVVWYSGAAIALHIICSWYMQQ